MCDTNDPMVTLTQLADDILTVVGASVVNEDYFVIKMQLLEDTHQPFIHDWNSLTVAIARDDGGYAFIRIRLKAFGVTFISTDIWQRTKPFRGEEQTFPQIRSRIPNLWQSPIR